MPVYDFINKNTKEVTTLTMKYADKVKYLEDHPEMETYFGDQVLNVGDPVKLGVRRLDGGFKEVLSRIADKTPGGKGMRDTSRFNF